MERTHPTAAVQAERVLFAIFLLLLSRQCPRLLAHEGATAGAEKKANRGDTKTRKTNQKLAVGPGGNTQAPIRRRPPRFY